MPRPRHGVVANLPPNGGRPSGNRAIENPAWKTGKPGNTGRKKNGSKKNGLKKNGWKKNGRTGNTGRKKNGLKKNGLKNGLKNGRNGRPKPRPTKMLVPPKPQPG